MTASRPIVLLSIALGSLSGCVEHVDWIDGAWSQVEGGCAQSFALHKDGTITSWGGISSDPPIDPPSGDFVSISAGCGQQCALDGEGIPTCWGTTEYTPPSPPAGSFVQVDVRASPHKCGLREDGTVECWGCDQISPLSDYGQCEVPDESFRQISVAGDHASGVTVDDRLVCWGDHAEYSGLDGLEGVAQVASGTWHTCVLWMDGSVDCSTCSFSDQGQCESMDGPFVEIQAGTSHNCGVGGDGSVVCWGSSNYGATNASTVPMRHLGVGFSHNCGVTFEGEILCWGDDQWGQSSPPI